jgi:arsenite methyltransferase
MSAITSRVVIDHYSALARENDTRNAEHIKKVAESFGYSAEDLAGIPEEANLGVSCGNPLAVAGLKAVSCLVPFSFLSSIVGVV